VHRQMDAGPGLKVLEPVGCCHVNSGLTATV
jgi:hypothetical protein